MQGKKFGCFHLSAHNIALVLEGLLSPTGTGGTGWMVGVRLPAQKSFKI